MAKDASGSPPTESKALLRIVPDGDEGVREALIYVVEKTWQKNWFRLDEPARKQLFVALTRAIESHDFPMADDPAEAFIDVARQSLGAGQDAHVANRLVAGIRAREIFANLRLWILLADLTSRQRAALVSRTAPLDRNPSELHVARVNWTRARGNRYGEQDILLLGDGMLVMLELKGRSKCGAKQVLNYLRLSKDVSNPGSAENVSHTSLLVVCQRDGDRAFSKASKWISNRDSESLFAIDPGKLAVALSSCKTPRGCSEVRSVIPRMPVQVSDVLTLHRAASFVGRIPPRAEHQRSRLLAERDLCWSRSGRNRNGGTA